MEFIYDKYYFKTKIEIEPNMMNSFTHDYINKNITLNILNKFEDKCNSIGFVKKNSIKLIKRSLGFHNPITFNNKIYFNVLCSAEICKPIKNDIYLSKITGINKIGITSKIHTNDNSVPLSIIISKHNQSIDTSKLKIGNLIYIQILAKKFTLNSDIIKTIANIVDDNYIINLKKHYTIIKELFNIELPKNYKKYINKFYTNNLKYIINNNIVKDNILFIYTYLIDISKYELKKSNIKNIKKKFLIYINSINKKTNNNKSNTDSVLLEEDINIEDYNYIQDNDSEDETETDNDNLQNTTFIHGDIDFDNLEDDDENDDEDDEDDEDDDNNLEDDENTTNLEIHLEGSGSGSIGSGSYKCE